MGDNKPSPRSLFDIIRCYSPRGHEFESLWNKVRSRQRGKALQQISELYNCTSEEASVVLDAVKPCVFGEPMRFQEITYDQVDFPRPWNERGDVDVNPFAVQQHYFARIGAEVFQVTPRREGDHCWLAAGTRQLKRSGIDQLWKAVPAQ